MNIALLRKIGVPEADIKKHFLGKHVKVTQSGGFIRIKADEKSYFTKPTWEFYVERVNFPHKFDKRSFRKKIIRDRQILVACPKGKWDAIKGVCRVGTQAVSISRPLKVTREGLGEIITDKFYQWMKTLPHPSELPMYHDGDYYCNLCGEPIEAYTLRHPGDVWNKKEIEIFKCGGGCPDCPRELSGYDEYTEADEAATSKKQAWENLKEKYKQLFKGEETEGVVGMYEHAALKAGWTIDECERLFRGIRGARGVFGSAALKLEGTEEDNKKLLEMYDKAEASLRKSAEKGALGSADIRKPSTLKGKIKLKFKTSELLKLFGLPDTDFLITEFDTPSSDVTVDVYMTMERDDDGNIVDMDGKTVPEEAIEEVHVERDGAAFIGTESRAIKEVYETLEKILETFSDYKYEYAIETPQAIAYGTEYAQGTAKGIESVDIAHDVTTITAHKDIVHIINDNIAGVGMFMASYELEGDSVQEFAQTRFSWLKNYWDIYGGRKPEVDFDSIDDFDGNHYIDRLREIEKRHKIRILSKSRQQEADKRMRRK